MDNDTKCCLNCEHCIYIGEGDFICDADDTPVLIMSDFSPEDDYNWCNETEWESNEI